jgi:cell wall-associated NlpC family hydrolase
MAAYDPRLTPARADLAAKSLQGKVSAARYVDGRLCEVVAPQAPLRGAPAHEAPLATEALKGERVVVYDDNGEGWAWGQLQADGYVGWLPAHALAPASAPPTHKVVALRTFAFPGPSVKQPPIEALPFGARLAVARFEDRMAITTSGGYVPAPHLAAINVYERDHVAVAERFVGVPYLWGGKTALGLDCSGLVQIALAACGRSCPRDSDMQAAALGMPVSQFDLDDLRHGDLIFWHGHVAIVRDRTTLVHANAFHMAVVIEPTAEAVARIRAAGSEIAAVRRLANADVA